MRKISPFNLLLQRFEIKSLHFQVCSSNYPPSLSFCIENSFFTLKIPSLKINRYHPFLFFCYKKPFSTNPTSSPSVEKPTSISSSRDARKKTHIDFTSNGLSGIGKSVISRCSHIWEKKGCSFVGASLQDLLKLSNSSPGTIRRFWRVSKLNPEDFLQILLGFESIIQSKEVKFLWRLFNWADSQSRDFHHLSQSYEIMVLMLIRVGLLRESETVFQMMDIQGIILGSNEVFSKIIEAYAEACELDNSVAMYDRARNRENHTFESIIGILCKDVNVFEAKNLLKKVTQFGVKPSHTVLNDIADGYCEKKDFEDLMNFLTEWKYAPDARVCHKIISCQCRNFGVEKGWLFLQKLEALGFMPDQITFGILISWSCKEGNLKNAFLYLSEILDRGLKPDTHTYNALISGMFREGMGKHAKYVFYDIIERGITLDVSIFRVLLAGYCKDRKFDEAKVIVNEMVKYDLVSLSHSEDALSRAFVVLGLDRVGVKVKRDNDAGLPRTEFFDTLGNGLYLETDLDEYDKTIMGILDDAIIPNLDVVVIKECGNGDFQTALRVKSDMVQRGHKLSSSVYAELLKGLYASQFHSKSFIDLLEEMVEHRNQLDQETLNLLIRATSKKKMTYKARLILDGMLQNEMFIENETFTALITGFCKEKNRAGLQECWDLVLSNGWLPGLRDCKALFSCLCKWGMVKNAIDLFEIMIEKLCHSISNICDLFLKELCVRGFTSVGHILVDEILRRGLFLDHTAFNHLTIGFCKEKFFVEAFRMIDIMLEKNMIPCVDACRLLISQLCTSNRLDKAMSLRAIILNRQSEAYVSINSALVSGLCKIGKVKEAALQLQEMLAMGVCPDNDTFDVILQEHCRENNLTNALMLLCIMLRKNVNLSISSYRNLVRVMCMQGRVLNALRLKDFILKETELPHLIIYNIMIFSLFQTSSSLLVTALLDEMHQKDLIPDQATYNFLIYGYYKCKNFSKSVEMLNIMIDKNLRPSNRNFRMLISYLASNSELEKALEFSKMMESRGWMHGSVVQTALVEGLLSRDRFREAELFLSRIEEKGLIPDNISYDVLIRRFCGYGRLNKAVDLINMMLKKGSIPSDISYNAVIRGFCIDQAFDQALDFHAEMLHKNLTPSVGVYEALVHSLCANGRSNEAEQLFGFMLQSGQTPTTNMYQTVIDGHRLDNNLHKASRLLRDMQQSGHVPDFNTHWSLINNLSNTIDNDNVNSKGFLSQLLSESGFPMKNDKAKAFDGRDSSIQTSFECMAEI
ncbi:pentatricopeptide repeat (PPR) superfamily protein isoform X2 [Tasmannia lanceolata]|uniref:pentatricopeptide repeat (PPR) superfamily protein isoform X2 n=1 Tax=Tasmannia lanceolata TaxID=3420 RepID=UPI0040643022